MIYLPEINQDSCYFYLDNNTIVELPNNFEYGVTYKSNHFSINNHYESYEKNVTLIDTIYCINNQKLTTNYLYRSDLTDIIIFFLFVCIFIVYIPYRLASRFWRWLR